MPTTSSTLRALARALSLTVVMLAAASCASKRPPQDAAPETSDGRARPRSADVITADEIREFAGSATNAYDLIRQRRSTFLRPRGVRSSVGGDQAVEMNEPRVFLDGVYFGPSSALRDLSTSSIAEIRFYNVAAAAMRFGQRENASPVIEVTTKK